MIYHLLSGFTDGPLNVVRYATFRAGAALLTALIICWIFGRPLIDWLRVKQGRGQPIRQDGPQTHLTKAGTPTMGGVMILGALTISTLLWANLTQAYVWLVLFVTLGFGAIGFWDDFLKVSKRNPKGASGRLRLGAGFLISLIAAVWAVWLEPEPLRWQLAVPVFKSTLINLSWFFVPFAMCVMVGTANAVNFTDGLDGLAIVPVMIAGSAYAAIAYFVGNSVFANYLQLHYVPGVGELAVFFAALVGAGLGFLWYNAPPAMVFMGDTGSLSLGGGLGAAAVATKHEIVLLIVGGLFVVETLSVIIQVVSFKLTGKRVFRMAPIHHHFEQKGWKEPTIVIRFWIISGVLALLGLATLKLR